MRQAYRVDTRVRVPDGGVSFKTRACVETALFMFFLFSYIFSRSLPSMHSCVPAFVGVTPMRCKYLPNTWTNRIVRFASFSGSLVSDERRRRIKHVNQVSTNRHGKKRDVRVDEWVLMAVPSQSCVFVAKGRSRYRYCMCERRRKTTTTACGWVLPAGERWKRELSLKKTLTSLLTTSWSSSALTDSGAVCGLSGIVMLSPWSTSTPRRCRLIFTSEPDPLT